MDFRETWLNGRDQGDFVVVVQALVMVAWAGNSKDGDMYEFQEYYVIEEMKVID